MTSGSRGALSTTYYKYKSGVAIIISEQNKKPPGITTEVVLGTATGNWSIQPARGKENDVIQVKLRETATLSTLATVNRSIPLRNNKSQTNLTKIDLDHQKNNTGSVMSTLMIGAAGERRAHIGLLDFYRVMKALQACIRNCKWPSIANGCRHR